MPDNESFDEMLKKAESGELTEENLHERLTAYANAIRQEYEVTTKAAPENVEEYTRDFFKKNIHAAAAQVVWLSINAHSESTRFSASKYVIEAALHEEGKSGDPIAALIKELQGNPPPLPATSNND